MSSNMVDIGDVMQNLDGGTALPSPGSMIPTEPQYEGRERKMLRRNEMWERRMQMAAMFAAGKYLTTIAKKFGVSISTVSKEISQLVAEYQAKALKSVGTRVAEEEALIYMIQLEAINAWFESKEGKITNTSKRAIEIKSKGTKLGRGRKGKEIGPRKVIWETQDELDAAFGDTEEEFDPFAENGEGKEGQLIEATKKEETSPGDPRFLQIILDCSDRRAKLFNLYPKLDGAGGGYRPGGEEGEIEEMTPMQRVGALRQLLDKARLKRAAQYALNESTTKGNLEAMNQRPLSIFEQRAQQLAPLPEPIPTSTSSTVSQDLEALWDASS